MTNHQMSRNSLKSLITTHSYLFGFLLRTESAGEQVSNSDLQQSARTHLLLANQTSTNC